MKQLAALLLCAAPTLALASTDFKNVPPLLQKVLHGGSLKTVQFENGVLRTHMDKPEVSELVYSTFVFHSVCAQQWRHPQEFASLGLTRAELFNATGTQGFAFDARADVCAQMGEMGKNFRSFIQQRTVACKDGSCPPPR